MDIFVVCPHCNSHIVINMNDINCSIFRHGILKENGKQMDPHTPKQICDFLFKEQLIFGCGKPFRLVINNNYHAIKCDYI
jgi:hypothetical protein